MFLFSVKRFNDSLRLLYLRGKLTIMRTTIYFTLLLFLFGCVDRESSRLPFKEGDILFQDLDCGALCDAIEKVTEGVDGRDFSHCGVVVKEGEDSLVVIEAIGSAVVITPLEEFLQRSGDKDSLTNILIGRPRLNVDVISAITFLRAKVGQPYDDAFLPNNDKYYCSELIADAYRDKNGDRIFIDAPMTFKDPETGSFFPAWEEYYLELGVPIPEGVLGINPGLISRSSSLSILKGNNF